MNAFKPLFVVAVLAAVAYGVYVSINRKPAATDSPGEAPAWPGNPQVQIPGSEAVTPQFPDGTSDSRISPQAPYGSTTLPGSNLAATPPTTGSGGPASPPFLPQGISNAPAAAQTNDAASAYPSPGYPGPPSNLSVPGAPPLADSSAPSSSPYDNLARKSDSLSGSAAPGFDPSAGVPPGNTLRDKYATFMDAVQRKLDEGQLAEAHLAVSRLYDDPEMPPDQAHKVIDLLDQLAGTVIYSREHLLEPPYTVQPGDTLQRIAETYNVPWVLLARINGIRDPRDIRAGDRLKVVRGPFSAVVNLHKYELTLMLKGRYAGRFPVGVGRDHPNLEGSYVVCNQTIDPQYYGPDGRTVRADDQNNPLGEYWIGLGERIGQDGPIGIHGTYDPNNLHRTAGRGSICLGEEDIDDVFHILSIGSRVVIRR